MAKCTNCGAKIGFLSGSGGYCLDCAAAEFKAGEGARLEAKRLADAASAQEAVQVRN